MRQLRIGMVLSAVLAMRAIAFGQPFEQRVSDAIMRAVQFFRTKVAVNGSYLWVYSADLKVRRGEGEATETQGWVQPPGTPSVGMTLLRAYEATGERYYLEGALETAYALTETQLASGGWDYRIEFHPERRKRWFYRKDVEVGERDPKGRRNISVYDDDNTQSALRFLIRMDVTLKGSNAEIRKAVDYGLTKLMEAQYPNGGWGQIYDGNPPDLKKFPVMPARYPATWSRIHPGKGYDFSRFYTLNDNVMLNNIRTLLEAFEAYRDAKYLQAARKGGDFLLLAQMPEPQPAWAQQYDFEMQPAWARRFEPPAIVSGESAGAIRALMELYLVTGDERYFSAIAKAVAWLRQSQLPDGQWARFYELQTNRPLYFNRRYELVYTDDDLPTHYAFKGDFGIPSLLRDFERLQREGREGMLAALQRKPTAHELKRRLQALERQIERIIAAQDDEGRWVEDGQIRTHTFIRNVEVMAEYLQIIRVLRNGDKAWD
ncbi:MAG: pectate lyase [Armatimonadota bacterium]|nr:pectic acid lyase [Armatimonadota bacterium]MDW8026512.1 pectate lyase [Armatimonadota bacterium]